MAAVNYKYLFSALGRIIPPCADKEKFMAFFSTTLGKLIITFFVSMVPVNRAARRNTHRRRHGAAFLGSYICFLLSEILFPCRLLLYSLKKYSPLCAKNASKLDGLVTRLENKANSKSETVQKYAFWGLFIFVAIPLPGTGAWTGALIAAMLEMKLKKHSCQSCRRAFRRGNSYLCNIPCACISTLFCIGDRPCRFAKPLLYS